MFPSNIQEYSHFIYSLQEQYPPIQHSTLVLIPIGHSLAKVEGCITFHDNVVVDVWELVDFYSGRILNYSYEIYRDGVKDTWYDLFEHPNVPELQSTYPHHKHIQPDIKHHRVPAPGISFEQPNLDVLIEEIEQYDSL